MVIVLGTKVANKGPKRAAPPTPSPVASASVATAKTSSSPSPTSSGTVAPVDHVSHAAHGLRTPMIRFRYGAGRRKYPLDII
jgi:hypothetical protein